MVVRLPSGTTQAELQQVQNLIFKGKGFATRGDPKLTLIRQFLQERGFRSAQDQLDFEQNIRFTQKQRARDALAKAEAEKKEVVIGGVSKPVRITPDIRNILEQERINLVNQRGGFVGQAGGFIRSTEAY